MNHCPVARVRERELGDGQRITDVWKLSVG